jgi:transposase
MRIAMTVNLSEEDRQELLFVIRSPTSPARSVERARIVLLSSEGHDNKSIALELNIGRNKVARWRKRYVELGTQGLWKDAEGRGRKAKYSKEDVEALVKTTIENVPSGRTHWSRRSMSEHSEMSESTIGRFWKKYGLKPHLHRTFKVSNDKNFTEKLEDVVGLYLNPPENAIVFSCDEKSQIQALDRTQTCLPMDMNYTETMTHDYKRNGTTSLFAALNTATGEVIGTCKEKHTHKEWISFLKIIEKQTPKEKDIHIICDNYATHKHPKVKSWLKYHKRVKVHFTPTSASWLNMVERFFRDITENALRRGVFSSVKYLKEAIHEYLDSHNENPKPFIWTASASDILEKVTRARSKLNTLHQL